MYSLDTNNPRVIEIAIYPQIRIVLRPSLSTRNEAMKLDTNNMIALISDNIWAVLYDCSSSLPFRNKVLE